MNNTKHTPEPWKLDWDGDNLDCIHNDNSVIAMAIGSHDPDDCYIKITRQDAERIVACVNALAGVDDPEKEIAKLKEHESVSKEFLEKTAWVQDGDFPFLSWGMSIVDILNKLIEHQKAEIAGLRAENDTLRGLLGNSALPCVYCGLPANEQGKCAEGFPGCSRADDMQLSHLFGVENGNECMRKDIETLRDALKKVVEYSGMCETCGFTPLAFSIAREALAKVARKEGE